MTSSSRRQGFRLPWGEESAGTDAPPAGTAPEATAPAATDAAKAASPDAFLGSLTDAMRGVVESARQDSTRQARTAVEERLATMKAEAAQREADLRTRTEADVMGFEEWSRAEADRIRTETDKKIEQRRKQLEDQLTEHERRTTAQVSALEARLADHEKALETFFAGLEDIKDPAAFIAAARTMPALALTDEARAAAVTKSEPKAKPEAKAAEGEQNLNDRLRDLGLESEAAEAAPAAPETKPAATETKPTAPAPTATSAPATTSAPAAVATVPPPKETPAPASAPAAASGGTAFSDVTAHGLASFGAVTALKQTLAKVDGIEAVTLSLGPTGEFMYRVGHVSGLDVEAALHSAQPDATVERAADGSYRLEVPAAA